MTPPAADLPRGQLHFTTEGLVWLGAAVLLGALAWRQSLNLLLVVAYAMIVLLALNAVMARSHVERLRAVRQPLPPVFADEAVRPAIAIENVSGKRATATIQDESRHWYVEGLAPRGSAECVEPRRFPFRGRFNVPLIVASGFPFGLLRFERTEAGASERVVLPALGQIDGEGLRRWMLRQAGSEGRSRKVLRRATTDLADVRGVRPYRPGDSIRAIHWRSSARRRELMVREYDAAPSPDLVVVVEPWLPAPPSAADRANLEAALSLAATIVQAWCAPLESRVVLVVAGADGTRGGGPAGAAGIRELLIPLADAAGAAEFPAPAAAAFGRALGRAARLVVSSRPNSPLPAALSRLTGRHFLAIDPSQPAPWYQPPQPPAS